MSVVIPTHNRTHALSSLLREAVESVLRQDYADLELIVVADGCQDETENLLRTYGDRIRTCRHARRNTSASLNLGARAAVGRYLAFLDDDDLWAPSKLAQQIPLLEADDKLGFTFTSASYLDSQGYPIEAPTTAADDPLSEPNGIPASSGVIRRSLFDRLGGFDERLYNYHDWDLWLRASLRADFGKVPIPLTIRRIHPAHSRHKETHQRITDQARVLRTTGRAIWGSKRSRAMEAGIYQRRAVSCEEVDQQFTAGCYYRMAVRASPLVCGTAFSRNEPLPRLIRILQTYRKGVLFGLYKDRFPMDPENLIAVKAFELTRKLPTWMDRFLAPGDCPGGDWDRETWDLAESELYRSIIQRFKEGRRWEDTAIFRTYASRFDRNAPAEMVRWTRTLPQLVREYHRRVDGLYRNMRDQGFVLRFDTRGRCLTEVPHVHIGRSGDILFGRNGNHRLSIAKVLGLDRFFCEVRARHQDWQALRDRIATAGPELGRTLVDPGLTHHPDLQRLLVARGADLPASPASAEH